MNGQTIGAVARQANVHVETLRYYERRGLVTRPLRSVANYRLYSPETVMRARFIKYANQSSGVRNSNEGNQQSTERKAVQNS